MKKKEIKKTKLKSRKKAEVKENQFGVILEQIEHKFDLLTEGFSGVQKDIKRLDEKIDNNHEKFIEFKNVIIKFRNETNDNFKTLFKFGNETNNNFKTNFEYLSKIDDEIQSIMVKELILLNFLK